MMQRYFVSSAPSCCLCFHFRLKETNFYTNTLLITPHAHCKRQSWTQDKKAWNSSRQFLVDFFINRTPTKLSSLKSTDHLQESWIKSNFHEYDCNIHLLAFRLELEDRPAALAARFDAALALLQPRQNAKWHTNKDEDFGEVPLKPVSDEKNGTDEKSSIICVRIWSWWPYSLPKGVSFQRRIVEIRLESDWTSSWTSTSHWYRQK